MKIGKLAFLALLVVINNLAWILATCDLSEKSAVPVAVVLIVLSAVEGSVFATWLIEYADRNVHLE